MAKTPSPSPNDTAEMVTISAEELAQLRMAANAEPNPEPAFEEGPHLKKADIRDAKLAQLGDAGFKASDDDLTDDMRSVLEGK